MAKRSSTATRSRPAKKRSARRGKAGAHRASGRDPFARLDTLARNLWWTWNPGAKRLFESMEPAIWRAVHHNPIDTMAALPPTRRDSLAKDPRFLGALAGVENDFKKYLDARTWYARTATAKQKKMSVAYFCMEYGLHESIPLYAGGLGILAADHLKSASDLGIPLTGVGILWRYGYYRQEIEPDGHVRVLYPASDFERLPVTDTGKAINVPIGRADVRAKIWRLDVGRIALYLLDTDLPENTPADRALTHHLYGGDNEYRIRQEVLLGIGGLLALDELGIKATVFHLNEGHAAFAPLERVRRAVRSGRRFETAVEDVRSSSVFTTHTPVPEGNDRFEIRLFNKYLRHYAKAIGVSEHQLHALGREDESSRTEPFCMTVLALKLAAHCNGVAELHADTSRKMWMKTFGVTDPKKVPIGHVTNGIHPETWLADEARPFYDKHLKPKWVGAGPGDDWWAKAKSIPVPELWELRQMLRRKMVAQLRTTTMREQLIYHNEDGPTLEALYDTLDEDALTIGFARRFALYKRAPLIFRDAARLAKIMGDSKRPVQLIFAGKAHPLDKAGHEYVRQVTQFTRKAPFRGRVWIIENYDTAIGRMLTQGCDVWLNNPIRPMEASGTSGMKPPLNGGMNCSILDGWWPEAYNAKNGWAIGDGSAARTRPQQDKQDAEAIYRLLEKEIVPLFYDRDRGGVPRGWAKMMAESMRTICCEFSTHRMLADYVEGYYWPAHA